MKKSLILLTVLLTAFSAFSAQYYVNAARADNGGSGTSWGTAKKTIQAAVKLTKNGDTVWVTNGTYVLSAEISVTNAITIRSVNGPEATMVNGGGSNRCFNLSGGCLISGLTIINGAAWDANGGGVHCADTIPAVSNCVFRGNAAPAIIFYPGAGGGMFRGTAIDCVFDSNGAFQGGGMAEGRAQNCIFKNNYGIGGPQWGNCYGAGMSGGDAYNSLFVGNTGCFSGSGMYGGTAFNCTFVNNWTHFDGGALGNSTAYNCIFKGNEGEGRAELANSLVYNSCSAELTNGIDGNITNAPLFVDAANGDFRLQSSSPCINRGGNSAVSNATDLAGNPRILDGTVDMGAYEYNTNTHRITTTAGTNGTITPVNPAVAQGYDQTFSIQPAAGYVIASLIIDGVPVKAASSYTFTRVQSAHTIAATYTMDSTKPTVAITAPTAGLRVTNAVYTVRGTAADNKAMAGVLVQVNGEIWINAVTTNGWKNWSLPVTLTPGANTIRAYSRDVAQNNSLTSTVVCTYVVYSALTIQTNGPGSVTRTPTGVPEVGKTYTLTATPKSGCGLKEWTGDAVSNPTNKVVTFVMTPNKTITANFIDIQKPVVAISYPLSTTRTTNGNKTVKGTASDNARVTNVLCRINNGAWETADTTNGWKNWSIPFALTAGPNLVEACSIDSTGNVSTFAKLSFSYVVYGSLIIQTNGSGTITQTPAGVPEIGRTYTLTAAPKTGYGFASWTGDVTGSNKVTNFIMTSNKTVTANFTDIQKPTVIITVPTASLRISETNGLFTVRGTATDNKALTNVLVQLNGGSWANAVTTNGWKNWSAAVTLTPGTNTIRACSVDTAGNCSTTSSVVCTYAMTVPPFEYNGHIYKLVSADKATWAAAKAAAEASVLNGMKGHLAVIETPEENDAVFAALNPAANPSVDVAMPESTHAHPDSGARGIWLGASDSGASIAGASEGKFFWIARGIIAAQNFWTSGHGGSVVSGTCANWGSGGEPDNWTGAAAKQQDHVAMQIDDWPLGTAGQWNDLDGNRPQAYLIEYDNDEKDIRAFYAEMKRVHEKHDQDGLFALFSPDYIHQGEILSDWYPDTEFINTIRTVAFNITRITIAGNDAKVSASASASFYDGSSAVWPEPDTANDSPGFGWLRKTADGWRVIGDQVRAKVNLTTGHQINSGYEEYFFWMWAMSSVQINSVTVSGPGMPDTALEPDYSGGFSALSPSLSAPLPVAGTKYSFLIQFADGSQQTYQDTIKSWVLKGPVITVSPGAGAATIRWTSVSGSVPNADHYFVRVSGFGVYWESDDLPLTRTSAVFNENGMAEGTLQGGGNYYAEVFIVNKSDDYACRWVEFAMPYYAASGSSASLDISGSCVLQAIGAAPDNLLGSATVPQTLITVDGAVKDWANVPRSSFSYPPGGNPTVTQEVAVALSGNNIALLLTGCPFDTNDNVLAWFKLRLTCGDGDNRHSVDLWTSGSTLYGMIDGSAIAGLEAVLTNGVLEVKFPVPGGQTPSQVILEEAGCGMDLGGGTLTELFRFPAAAPSETSPYQQFPR